MAWSDEARAAAALARRMHGSSKETIRAKQRLNELIRRSHSKQLDAAAERVKMRPKVGDLVKARWTFVKDYAPSHAKHTGRVVATQEPRSKGDMRFVTVQWPKRKNTQSWYAGNVRVVKSKGRG